MTISRISTDELVIPRTIDEPEAADFIRAIEIINEVEAITYGTPDLAYAPEEELPYFHDKFQRTRMLVARIDGEIVGVTRYETGVDDEADTAWISVLVLPSYRRQGIGSALMRGLEDFARLDGRPKAVVYQGAVDLPGEKLVPPTGSRSVPSSRGWLRRLLKQDRIIDSSSGSAQPLNGGGRMSRCWAIGCPQMLPARASRSPRRRGPSSGSLRPTSVTRRAPARGLSPPRSTCRRGDSLASRCCLYRASGNGPWPSTRRSWCASTGATGSGCY